MQFKDILSIVTGRSEEHVIGLGEQLAEQNAGAISTLVVNWRPSFPIILDGWMAEPVLQELLTAAQKHLLAEVAAVAARLERDGNARKPESMLLELELARSEIGLRARHADIAVVGRPTKENSESAQAIVESVLFNSGRPVLVAPPEWKRGELGRNVLVCWKPTREAARALGDAEHFLKGAAKVTVATVDAKPSEDGYGQSPGADICTHLARRGVAVELNNLDTLGRSEAQALQEQALAVGADLIVMGGYGRSRLTEFIFGGVTREMLKACPVPLLLAH